MVAPVDDVDDEKRDAHNFGVDGFAGGGLMTVAVDSVVVIEVGSDGVVMSPKVVAVTTGTKAMCSFVGEPSTPDTDVLVDIGDPGRVDTSVTSVTADEEMVEFASIVTVGSAWYSFSFRAQLSDGSATGRGFGGDAGGVGKSKAFDMISSGGCARGEIMIPGAFEGSPGRRDQIAIEVYEGREGA